MHETMKGSLNIINCPLLKKDVIIDPRRLLKLRFFFRGGGGGGTPLIWPI